jgi:uncharacterized protein (TIGR00290 family)
VNKTPAASAQKQAILVSWSGGKDSCFALHEMQKTPNIRVEALLTTVTRDFDRISMHGVRRVLLERQAESLGLPLQQIFIARDAGNDEYEQRMGETFATYRDRGTSVVAFGDLFLRDIRAYRERLLARFNMTGMFPVWGRDTTQFIREFIGLGFKAIIVCVDPAQLDPSFSGRLIDEDFLSDLPPGADPCGENGEFHTFVFDGPNFRKPVNFTIGEILCRDSFWFCDLVPVHQ